MRNPNMAIRPFNPNTPNADIVEAIRNEASSDYQRHIPDPIKGDVKATLRALTNYQPLQNEFVSGLVNKIGLQIAKNTSWTNPLAKFKEGLVYGDTVEETQIGLLKSYAYDPRREYGEKALFGKNVPDVQSSYHTVNSERSIKLTIQRRTLMRAFTEEYGIASFISQLMEAPMTSDNFEEYQLMVSLFRQYEDNGGFFKVHVDSLAGDDDGVKARRGLRTLREFAETLPFISTHYNAAGMPVAAKPEDLTLFVTPQFKSGMDVNALAAMFNVEYGQIPYKVMTIPEADFAIPGAQAVLTTEDFFKVYDTEFYTDSQPNPAGRYENHFLHHDQIISASRFVPAILFTTGAGDVINIVDTPVSGVTDITVYDRTDAEATNLKRGDSYLVDASAISDGDNTAVILELVGAESNHTYLTQTGTMHVAIDEKATSLTIRATAEDADEIVKTRTLNVVGDRVDFWPNPSTAVDSDNDGLTEVTPEEPGFADNVVTIPTVTGVQYSLDGSPVNNGSTHTITADATVTAAARAGNELATGATASWTFVHVA